MYWYRMAKRLCRPGSYEVAIECLDKAIKLHRNHFLSWSLKGELSFSLNKYEDAIECFQKSSELNSKRAFVYLNKKAVALSKLDLCDEAVDCLKKSLSIYSENSETYELLGNIYLNGFKDYPKAIKYFKKSLYYNSKDSALWNTLANAYLITGEFREALECCHRAYFIDPKNYHASITEGKINYELKKYKDALYYAEEAKEINPTDPEVLMLLDKVNEALSQNVEDNNENIESEDNVPIEIENDETELNNEGKNKNTLRYSTEVFKNTSPQIIKPEDIDNNQEAFEKWMYHENIVSITKDDDDIAEEVKMKYIQADEIKPSIKWPKLTRKNLKKLNFNEREKYYHYKHSIPLLEKWLKDNTYATSEEINKKQKRLKYMNQQLDKFKIKALGSNIPAYEKDIHFYFSSKQFLNVMIEVNKNIIETSYNKVLKKILKFKDKEVIN